MPVKRVQPRFPPHSRLFLSASAGEGRGRGRQGQAGKARAVMNRRAFVAGKGFAGMLSAGPRGRQEAEGLCCICFTRLPRKELPLSDTNAFGYK